jgi:uncharacterized protein (TIGR03118 family)
VPTLTDKNGIVHRALHFDPDLVNPWGIAESGTSPFWISLNGKGLSKLYDAQGFPQSLVVTIPSPPPSGDPKGHDGKPTGAVHNPKTGPGGAFQISGFTGSGAATQGAAVFLFATEDGTIVGWNPTIFPDASGGQGTSTFGIITPVDNSSAGAVYKGLAIGTKTDSQGNTLATRLYAANFASGTVEMFDENFHLLNGTNDFEDAFVDPQVPSSHAPFNVAVINGKVFVAFAVRHKPTGDNAPGGSSGLVDVFDLDGKLQIRFAQGGQLKAPWGMAAAPATFGALAGKLLIGNFGNGQINAFDPDGTFIDTVRDQNGKPIVIDGLWALQFGNGGNGGDPNILYFTAGPNDEKDGLFGSLRPSP